MPKLSTFMLGVLKGREDFAKDLEQALRDCDFASWGDTRLTNTINAMIRKAKEDLDSGAMNG